MVFFLLHSDFPIKFPLSLSGCSHASLSWHSVRLSCFSRWSQGRQLKFSCHTPCYLQFTPHRSVHLHATALQLCYLPQHCCRGQPCQIYYGRTATPQGETLCLCSFYYSIFIGFTFSSSRPFFLFAAFSKCQLELENLSLALQKNFALLSVTFKFFL